MTRQFKIIFLSLIVLIWFAFGTALLIRGTLDKSKLKTISGDLEFYDIVEISGHKHRIDVLTLKVKGHDDKVALYLNSEKEYLPILEKFEIKQAITILYNDKGGKRSEGYNLHIYEIVYGNEIIFDYSEATSTDKKVTVILYIVGLICIIPLLYVVRNKNS